MSKSRNNQGLDVMGRQINKKNPLSPARLCTYIFAWINLGIIITSIWWTDILISTKKWHNGRIYVLTYGQSNLEVACSEKKNIVFHCRRWLGQPLLYICSQVEVRLQLSFNLSLARTGLLLAQPMGVTVYSRWSVQPLLFIVNCYQKGTHKRRHLKDIE